MLVAARGLHAVSGAAFEAGNTLVQIELTRAIAVSLCEHALHVHEKLVQLDELREGELGGLVGIVHADMDETSFVEKLSPPWASARCSSVELTWPLLSESTWPNHCCSARLSAE